MTRTEAQVRDAADRTRRARPRLRDERITMAHGAGGKATATLVEALFLPAMGNPALGLLEDSGQVQAGAARLAFSTDGFVVHPLRFPGGSIGELAVNGTINDLAVSGARPLALSAAFILEEGLPIEVLHEEAAALGRAAQAAGVCVITADTKVVERGKADGMYIVTAGIGTVELPSLTATGLRPGDVVLCSGPIGDHGVAILLARGDLELEADVRSDTRPLWPLVEALAGATEPGQVRAMRDATRGGVATVLNELARTSDVGVVVEESAAPVRPAVRGACEMLGLDPLYVANEGVLVAVVAPEAAERALAALRGVPGGAEAARLGEVRADPAGMVLARSGVGGQRIMDLLIGDPLPRIC